MNRCATRTVALVAIPVVAASLLAFGASSASADSRPGGLDPVHISKGTVAAPIIRVVTDGDTYTSSADPTTANGQSPDLRVGNGSGSSKTSYLHFSVPTSALRRVSGAALTITRNLHHLPATTVSVLDQPGSWTEQSLTRASAPTAGPVLDTESVSYSTNSVTFDVGSVVKDRATVSLAVTSPISTDTAQFYSKESGVAAPTLTLTIEPARPAGGTGGSGPCAVSTALVSSCQVWLGDAPQAHALAWSPTTSKLAVDEAFSGRKFDIVHEYNVNGQLFPDSGAIALAAQGRMLLENWKPSTSLSWAAVAAGAADKTIDAEAAYLKSKFDRPFFLTIYHEPEDNVNPAAGSGMTTIDYRAMYRHVVQRLRAAGATKFVSVMNYMGYYRWDPMRDALYPGDDVVDWIAWDPYMHTPSNRAGGDFASLINTRHGNYQGFYDWATTSHPGKPLMLAEWGVYDDHVASNPAGPSQFYPTVAAMLPNFPAMKALVHFTMNPKDVPAGEGTMPTVTAAGLSAWRSLAQAPILNATTASLPIIIRLRPQRIAPR